MDRELALDILKAHEGELRAAGIDRLSLFGSVARGEATEASDVDILVHVQEEGRPEGLAYFGYLEDLRERLANVLNRPVDIVVEPIRKPRLQQEVERDRVVAFE